MNNTTHAITIRTVRGQRSASCSCGQRWARCNIGTASSSAMHAHARSVPHATLATDALPEPRPYLAQRSEYAPWR